MTTARDLLQQGINEAGGCGWSDLIAAPSIVALLAAADRALGDTDALPDVLPPAAGRAGAGAGVPGARAGLEHADVVTLRCACSCGCREVMVADEAKFFKGVCIACGGGFHGLQQRLRSERKDALR